MVLNFYNRLVLETNDCLGCLSLIFCSIIPSVYPVQLPVGFIARLIVTPARIAATPLDLLERRAGGAPAAWMFDDWPTSSGFADAAGCTARGPGTPFAQLAVSWCLCKLREREER